MYRDMCTRTLSYLNVMINLDMIMFFLKRHRGNILDFSGVGGGLPVPPCHSDGKSLHLCIILLAWQFQATTGIIGAHCRL
jgi:hypothetical protein